MEHQLTLTGEPEPVNDHDFDQWWAGYPVKRDKTPALRKYRALRRQGVTAAELERARDHYLEDCERNNRFVKYPRTFLGVWDEWAVPESPPVPEPVLPARTEVKFCPGCGELVDWCSCGVVLHRFTRP